ncbi:MAG TPA: hypothetical protein VLV85_19440 [Stellaceae bacterium]|nr:hypothetical protein [Stellaceae bacterium]
MGTFELLQAIDPEVMKVARLAARRAGTRFVIGWWVEGAERRLMLLPEGHHVTAEPPFVPVVIVTPSGEAERLAA